MTSDPTLTATATDADRVAASVGAEDELVRGAAVDRYLVFDRIGAGGMGIVYAAFDPELDRKVALKLVLPRSAGGAGNAGRARLLREAQALARLSHPNVVAVHDVGQHGERVWIAMEFVAGQTLGGWVSERQRRWPELLRVLADVVRGVAAAHATGLVHRDLKPDNIMISSDGRVRVMDFGLAHGREPTGAATPADPAPLPGDAAMAATLGADSPASPDVGDKLSLRLTRVGAIQGTPAYMAPEQWRGQEAGAAADQFGWSVMAWELLYGQAPFAGDSWAALAAAVDAGRRRSPPRGRRVPGWLRRVVERGLAVDPAQRWPTMTDLLAALERGRNRARLRTAIVLIAGAAAAGALVAGYREWATARQVADCVAFGSTIEAVWNDEARRTLRGTFVATGVSHAATSAERSVVWLDRQSEAWRTARTEACLRAEVEGTMAPDTLDRSLWCLDERRIALEETIAEFAGADAAIVHKAITTAAGLAAVQPCLDEDLLRRQPAPPTEGREAAREIRAALARASSSGVAGHYDDALTIASQAHAQALDLGWAPLITAAAYQRGRALGDKGDYDEAEKVTTAAYFEALRLGVWEDAAAAASELVFIVGYQLARHANGQTWADHAAGVAAHAGDPEGLRAADRLTNLALVHEAAGAYPESQRLHELVLAIKQRALGAEHPAIAVTLTNLANTHWYIGDFTRAQALYEQARVLQEATLGPEHPMVAATLNNLALVHLATGAAREGQALLEQALAIRERALGPNHPEVAATLSHLATVYHGRGDLAEARALYDRALALREQVLGPNHPDVAQSLANLAHLHRQAGDATRARALYVRVLAIFEEVRGQNHPEVAFSLVGLASLHLDAGESAEARPLLERAVAIFDAHAGTQEGEVIARFELAKLLATVGGEYARAVAEATRARDGFLAAGGAETVNLAAVDAWLAAHPAP